MKPLRTRDPEVGSPSTPDVYHGSTFDLTAAPGLEAVGTVTDADTGKPIPGARIETASYFGNPLRNLSTIADAQGRYRLAGIAPKDHFGQDQTLLASLDDGLPYLQAVKGLEKTDGVATVPIDFRLKRGVRLTGRVIDKSTGERVSAGFSYVIPLTNPYLKSYPRYDIYNLSPQFTTDGDGNFNLVVMPGPGVVGARAWKDHWRVGVGFQTLPVPKHDDGPVQRWIDGQPGTLGANNVNTLIAIDCKEGDAAISREITLDRGKVVEGKILDPEGRPVLGARIWGREDFFHRWSDEPLPSDQFLVEGIDPDAMRTIVVLHEARKLVGVHTIPPDETGPISLTLVPAAMVSGRIFDAEGKPVVGAEVSSGFNFNGREFKRNAALPTRTDETGRFRSDTTLAGRPLMVNVYHGDRVNQVAKEMILKPGEDRDLGDVTLDKK